jgi:hypothetical protein
MNRPVSALSRRGLITAAAGTGALVTMAHFLRSSNQGPSETSPPATGAARAQGYRLTEHIKRYYRTTLV